MPRIDRERMIGARFPVVRSIETRFSDLDMQGHVNNSTAITFIQEARAHLHRLAELPELRQGLRVLVVGLSVEYAGEMHHPDPVEVHSGILSLGRTSYVLGHIVRQGGRDCLFAEVAVALADENGSAPLPSALRESLEQFRVTLG